jgi:hypothetical protein
MAKGGFRVGSGRPTGAKDSAPRKISARAVSAAEDKGGSDESGIRYLHRLMNDRAATSDRRDRAAITLAQLEVRLGERLGKKQWDELNARTCHLGTKWAHLLPPDPPPLPDYAQQRADQRVRDKYATPSPPPRQPKPTEEEWEVLLNRPPIGNVD